MDFDTVRALVGQKKPRIEIAKLLGVSVDNLNRFCCKHNLTNRRTQNHPEWVQRLPQLIQIELMTQSDTAKLLGVSKTTIERWCIKLNLTTQRTGPRSGAGHPDWKGGKRIVGRYWYVYAPDHPLATKQHLVAEHRLIMEKILGRYLTRSEVVHHRNGDPSDNRPENLELFACNADHLREELTGRIPQWTPQGKERIVKALRKTRTHQI